MKTGNSSDSPARIRLRRVSLAAAAALTLGGLAPLPTASAAVDTGSITGVVTDDLSGDPLAGIEVAVWDLGPYGDVLVGSDTTDSAGTYTIDNIPVDPYYKVQFTDPTGDHAMEFYDDAIAAPPYAQWVPVTADHATPDVDASLEAGSKIAGWLTNAAGLPVDDGTVTLWWQVGPDSYTRVADYDVAPDGHYTVPGVRGAESYVVEFVDRETGAREAWDDATGVLSATPIRVTSGIDMTGLDAVLGGTVANTAAPTITGVAQVGQTLTAAPGTWSPASTTVAYRWVVGDDTTPNDDPTGATYVPTAQDIGKTIRVEATGTRGAGWTPATAWSGATAPVAAAPVPVPTPVVRTFTHGERPRITGKLRVGRTVRVATGTFTPSPTTVSFVWYANGKVIKNATKKRLTLKKKQLGKRLTVVVTASAPSYESFSVRSKRSPKVTG
ncbi:exported hypothetical protein [metagenome]|uniref:Uncharacterized protein n=1 Tax=metagenome TaxID=256318 RepID=A0A2P2C3S1_9ZZZZ